jgi:hypothetical protein
MYRAGVANTITGFFGGMGGCAMIGQSMINVKSGGHTRIAAAALFLLAFILFCIRPDQNASTGSAGRCYVHGRDRHVRVELVQDHDKGAPHGRV